MDMQPQKTGPPRDFVDKATKEGDEFHPEATVIEETGPKDQPEKIPKESVESDAGSDCKSAINSHAMIGWGMVFALAMCFALILAAHLHGWSQESVCAFIQSADQEPQVYPQPRCFNSSRFRNKTVIDTSGFFYYYWRLPEITWQGQFSAWLGYSLHQVTCVGCGKHMLYLFFFPGTKAFPSNFQINSCILRLYLIATAVVNMDTPIPGTKKIFQRCKTK